MSGGHGWNNGVYNPGIDYMALYRANRVKAADYVLDNIPEIKGVRFKQSKGQHKPIRNSVTRVVVGFDPFNHSGLPEHVERKVVFDYWARLENEFVQGWVDNAEEGELRFGMVFGPEDALTISNKEHNIVDRKHNPILTIRQNLELDKLRVTRGYVNEVAKVGITTDGADPVAIAALLAQPEHFGMVFENGKVLGRSSFDPIFRHTLCPEVEVINAWLFQYAGHIWKHTHSNWHVPGITGVVEPYIPTAEDLNPIPVTLFEGELHKDYDGDQPIMRGSHLSELVEITKGMSQCGRNETMAYMVVDRPDHVFDPIMLEALNTAAESEDHASPGFLVLLDDDGKPVSREGQLEYEQAVLKDQEEAMQEASEGKLDYLLEGTQWDPRNRK